MKKLILIILLSIFITKETYSQKIKLDLASLTASKINFFAEKFQNKDVIKIIKDPLIKDVDEPTYGRLKNIDFKNGTIEVSVLSRLLPTASPSDRGFIGIAFRINEDNTKFECIYIRPANGRADDQVRRNHSIQYFSFPEYKFFRLRKEAPEMYESYADMGLNEWIKLKIVIKGKQAKLFLNNAKEPSLIVNDMKHGADLSGSIGLFVDVGTEGYFRDLIISKE